MHLVYIDETGDQSSIGFSAVAFPSVHFNQAFALIKKFRKDLRQSDGIFTTVEFHASKFTSGRGRIAPTIVSQQRRCQIFISTLSLVAQLPGVAVFNAFRNTSDKLSLLERLLNRIEKYVSEMGSQAILFFDEGGEKAINNLARKMHVFNLIKSNYGTWPDGNEYKNIPLVSIVEDPVFRQSHRSYFVQLADFCAYSLFQKEKPTPSRIPFGLRDSFRNLTNVLVLKAFSSDEYGIIR